MASTDGQSVTTITLSEKKRQTKVLEALERLSLPSYQFDRKRRSRVH